MKDRVLIVDKMHDSIIPMLNEIGIVADYRPDISLQELEEIIPTYSGIIVRSKFNFNKTLLDKAKQLKFIARAGAGIDLIDLEEAKKKGIQIFNAPEGNSDSLAEHAIALVLNLLNRIYLADKQIREGVWDREGNRGYELKGKIVALIGYGHMGKAFAKRLKSFECKVLAYDKYLQNYSDEFVKESSMEEIFELTDILSFHIPLTTETNQYVDYNYLQKFKKDFWLLNTARGEILKLKDLILLIESGKIRGAALDVLENEKLNKMTVDQKLNFDLLVKSDKVLLSPHVGGWTYESYLRINEVLVHKIKTANILS